MLRVPPTISHNFTDDGLTWIERRREYRRHFGLALMPWSAERSAKLRARAEAAVEAAYTGEVESLYGGDDDAAD